MCHPAKEQKGKKVQRIQMKKKKVLHLFVDMREKGLQGSLSWYSQEGYMVPANSFPTEVD